jgi:hypothetical protein
MNESKASRLIQLNSLANVPFFTVLKRGESFMPEDFPAGRYMVRSSAAKEDQADYSMAGQSTTLGPVSLDKVTDCLMMLWKNNEVKEIIVQEYIDGAQWGVAFCFSKQSILLEYAGVFEGVTAGSVSPFTALLPTTLPRYQELQQQLMKIYESFGPCDVEFVNLEHPHFVQVRPITRDIAFDDQYARLKMQLQELDTECWHENDICRMLSERDDYSQTMSALYLQSVMEVYQHYLGKKINIPNPAFIKISEQVFMAASLEQQLIPGTWGTIRLAFKLPAIIASIRNREPEECSLPELMSNSVLLSLAYDLNTKQELFDLREKIRIELESRMTPEKMPVDFQYDKALSDSISFDKKLACWHQLAPRNAQGIIVVPGDFNSGPYFRLKQREQEIPAGVIVVCKHLYPEIGRVISDIRGVICEHGALSSHVAILAREYQVPLKIQAPIDKYE